MYAAEGDLPEVNEGTPATYEELAFPDVNGSFSSEAVANAPSGTPLEALLVAPQLQSYVYPNNQHFLTLRRSQGRAIWADRSYTTLEGLSFPRVLGNATPFIDLRLHQFDQADEHALNAGVGVRFGTVNSRRIFGVNAYYDFSRSHHASFNQIGIGLELLGDIFSLRMNGYGPVGAKSRLLSTCFYDCYYGNYFYLQETYLETTRGVNLELEAQVGDFRWGDIRIGVGPYYMNRKRGCRRNTVGVGYRLSSDIGNYFTLNLNGSYDSIFGSRVLVQMGVTFPFYFISGQGSFVGNSSRRLYRPVQRNDSMMLKKRTRYTTNF